MHTGFPQNLSKQRHATCPFHYACLLEKYPSKNIIVSKQSNKNSSHWRGEQCIGEHKLPHRHSNNAAALCCMSAMTYDLRRPCRLKDQNPSPATEAWQDNIIEN